MSESTCKGCGKTILWGKTPDGKNIPLDPSIPVYDIDPVNPGACERNRSAMASHFSTCSKANDFSGRKRK